MVGLLLRAREAPKVEIHTHSWCCCLQMISFQCVRKKIVLTFSTKLTLSHLKSIQSAAALRCSRQYPTD